VSEQEPEAPGPDTETDAADVDQDAGPPNKPEGAASDDPPYEEPGAQ
jgi:hypothetical protein